MDGNKMKPITFVRFEIRKPHWNNYNKPSETKNADWQKCLFIVFKDYNGNEFDWMPRWDEHKSMNELKAEIEHLNKVLCAEAHNGEAKVNDVKDLDKVDKWENEKCQV